MKKVELVRLSRIRPTQKLHTFQDGGYKYMACTPLTCNWGDMSPASPLVPTPLHATPLVPIGDGSISV